VIEYSKATQGLVTLRQKAANAKVQGRTPQDIPATLADLIEIYEILVDLPSVHVENFNVVAE
jgi:hypothetical protein